MTQKELNYTEDVYNHESLIISILENTMNELTDEKYVSLFEEHVDTHTTLKDDLKKLLEVNANE